MWNKSKAFGAFKYILGNKDSVEIQRELRNEWRSDAMLDTSVYKELQKNYQQIADTSLLDLFNADKNRADKFSLDWQGIHLDYSKNNINDEVMANLIKLAYESDLPKQIQAMFSGEKINNTENRAVLHTALRAIDMHSITDNQSIGTNNSQKIMVDGNNVLLDISRVLKQMRDFSNSLHKNEFLGYTGKKITDIVNIGIGGSDLGPVLVCEALKPYRKNKLKIHFISSVDGYQLLDVLADLNAETTLFIIASKTFTTQETMTNANSARKWFLHKIKNSRLTLIKNLIY